MHTRQFELTGRYCATVLRRWAYGELQSVMAILTGGRRKTLGLLVEHLPNDLACRRVSISGVRRLRLSSDVGVVLRFRMVIPLSRKKRPGGMQAPKMPGRLYR
jgi:hypothetical protein